MDGWTLLLVAIAAVALVLTLGGLWWDRRMARRRRQRMTAPSDREIPGFQREEVVPQYLSELEARQPSPALAERRLPPQELDTLAKRLDRALRLPVGCSSESFITEPDRGWAVTSEPVVLVCGEPVSILRELYPALELTMPRGRPLVLVMPEIDAVVLDALEINHLRGNLNALVVLAPRVQLDRAAEFVGAAVVSKHDLLAGYLPTDALGQCAWWISSARESWVLLEESAQA